MVVPGWNASINGVATPIIAGNLDFITLRLPAGEGQVNLRYENAASRYFFWPRWLLGATDMAGIVLVAWRSRSSGA